MKPKFICLALTVAILAASVDLSYVVLTVNSHFIGKQTGHANVLEAAFAVRDGQLSLPVGAQSFVRPPCLDAELEHGV